MIDFGHNDYVHSASENSAPLAGAAEFSANYDRYMQTKRMNLETINHIQANQQGVQVSQISSHAAVIGNWNGNNRPPLEQELLEMFGSASPYGARAQTSTAYCSVGVSVVIVTCLYFLLYR